MRRPTGQVPHPGAAALMDTGLAMKIAWDISIQSTPYRTGVERVQRNLLRELTRIDRKNEYLLIAKEWVDFEFALPDNFRVVDLSESDTSYLWRERLRPPLIKKEKVDIFHSPVSAVPVLGGCKKIATVHELPWVEREKGGEKVAKGHRVWLFLNTRFADRIVAVSYRTRGNILLLYPEAEGLVTVIHNAVDPGFHKLNNPPNRGLYLEDFGIPNAPFILFVGSLRKKKNLGTLLDAFENILEMGIGDLNIVLLGVRSTAWGDLSERLEKSALSKRVFAPGYVSDSDLLCFYNLAKIVVYPSLFEGFGLPPLEAMACGTPVITTYGGAIPEVVEEAAVLVEPRDVKGLREAILSLHRNKGLREEYIKRGYERVASFTWRKTAQEYLELYKELYAEAHKERSR